MLQKAKEKRLSRKQIYISDVYSEITILHRKDMEVAFKTTIREARDFAVIRYDKLITPHYDSSKKKKIGLIRKNRNERNKIMFISSILICFITA